MLRHVIAEDREGSNPQCWWCQTVDDDPGHTLFECTMFDPDRRKLNRILGRAAGPADIERIMCGEEGANWINNAALRSNIDREIEARRSEFIRIVTVILTSQEAEERARQAAVTAATPAIRRR